MTADTSRLQCSPEQLRIVREVLDRVLPGREVWAFGSRVGGRARPFSDLGLVVIGEVPMPLDLTAELREAFCESDLPWRIDLVDWALLDPAFRARVERDHLVIQSFADTAHPPEPRAVLAR